MNAGHPQPQELSDYVSGKLDEDSAAVVETHVAECPECEVTLQNIESKSDTLVVGLRETAKSPTEIFAREAEYQRAIDQAANLPEVTAVHGQPTAISAKSPDSADENLSKKLGPYELLAKLGEGGMGAVYRAQHEHLGKTVAIKIFPAVAMRDPALVGRFRREMKAVGALHHPNIVGAHDAGEANGVHFLVMEYVAGKDLSTLLKEQGPLSIEQALSCTLQAARGLEFAHRKGIVHRDIKPANLLLDEDGVLKILDMGLARLDDNAHNLAAQEGLTQSGQVMGTVDYMAPEQAFDTHRADAKADVYSLGCTLYRLLTGKNAYAGETVVQKILAHREKPIPSLRAARPEVPAALDALCQRMLAKYADERIGMSEVVKELVVLQTPSPAPATESLNLKQMPALATVPVVQNGGGQRKIPSSWLAAGFGGAAALVLLTIVFIIRDKEGKEIGRIHGPDGSSVTVQGTDATPKQATPQNLPPKTITPEPPKTAPTSAKVFVEWEKQLAALSAQEIETSGNLQAKLNSSAAEKIPDPSTVPSTSVPPPQKFGFEQPDFAAWAAEVGRSDAETQRALVIKKLQELNPGYDGVEMHRTQNNALVELYLSAEKITDLSPVRALVDLKILKCVGTLEHKGALRSLAPLQGMQLERLEFYLTQVADLSPLRGMPLTAIFFSGTEVTDLKPLAGMPLTQLWFYYNKGITDLGPLRGAPLKTLHCYGTGISDLAPLTDSPLTILYCQQTQISDLSPLRGKALTELNISFTPVTNLEPLATCTNLKKLFLEGTKLSSESIAALQKTLPNCKITQGTAATSEPQTADTETDEQWEARVAKLPVDDQIKAVSRRMIERNPGFDGKFVHAKPANSQVVSLRLSSVNITDLSPVRGFPQLKELICTEYKTPSRLKNLEPLHGLPLEKLVVPESEVTDLAPLRGMPLTELNISSSKVADLAPLHGMKLKSLYAAINPIESVEPLRGMPLETLILLQTRVTDFSPLQECPLKTLDVSFCKLSDLTPFKELPLENLQFAYTAVSDLSPLQGTKIKSLNFENSKVSDLSPLKGLPLKFLWCNGSNPCSDYSVLKELPLESLRLNYKPERDKALLEAIPTLKSINLKSAKEFWAEDATPTK